MPFESVIDLLGPFLIPVGIFAIGAVGYGVLLVLGRRGLL
jgi:hypothetical protein